MPSLSNSNAQIQNSAQQSTITVDSSSVGHLPNITHHFLPVKLNSENFLLWKAQFLPILHTNKLMGIVDGSQTSPPKEILDPINGQLVSNPAYESG
uniref:Retrotransposon Copia-like N-terminal domain-containing protein n=1 Tax=Nelumbo nucifera TaxID=4432 RepID=A0A822ZPV1_NELNU|nr:TPA_asm: hypothetical protein HUJ06_003609 [Nelumbo nucifera]